MLAANHTIVAGVAGSYIGNPFLAFLVGIIIHFALDAVPHFDTTDDGDITARQLTLIIVDFLIGLLIIFYVMHVKLSFDSPFVWGAIGGNFPDLLDNIPFWQESFRNSKIGGRIHHFHEIIHSKLYDKKPIQGMLSQYLIIALFVWLYLTKVS